MGSICSKHDYDKMSQKKSKKRPSEKTPELEKTMHDDARIRRPSQRSNKSSMDSGSSEVKHVKKSYLESVERGDGVVGFTSNTLTDDSDLVNKVKLPDNVRLEEWVYDNLMGFVETISILYDSIAEECTSYSCPEMSAGPHYTYLWTDSSGTTPLAVTANDYVNRLFNYITDLFNTDPYRECRSHEFTDDFMPLARNLFKKLFRVYAHVYHHHLQSFTKMGAEAHLNSSFKHFLLFEREFRLINRKEELPLRKLIARLIGDEGEEYRGVLKKEGNTVSYRKSSPREDSDE